MIPMRFSSTIFPLFSLSFFFSFEGRGGGGVMISRRVKTVQNAFFGGRGVMI